MIFDDMYQLQFGCSIIGKTAAYVPLRGHYLTARVRTQQLLIMTQFLSFRLIAQTIAQYNVSVCGQQRPANPDS